MLHTLYRELMVISKIIVLPYVWIIGHMNSWMELLTENVYLHIFALTWRISASWTWLSDGLVLGHTVVFLQLDSEWSLSGGWVSAAELSWLVDRRLQLEHLRAFRKHVSQVILTQCPQCSQICLLLVCFRQTNPQRGRWPALSGPHMQRGYRGFDCVNFLKSCLFFSVLKR